MIEIENGRDVTWNASLDEGKKKQRVDEIINRSDRHGVGGSRRNEAESEEEPVARQVCAEWKLSVAWHGGLVGGDSLLNAQPPRLTLVNVCIPSTCLCFYRRCLRLRHHRYWLPLPSLEKYTSRYCCPRVRISPRGSAEGEKEKEKFIHCILYYYQCLNSFSRNSIVFYIIFIKCASYNKRRAYNW